MKAVSVAIFVLLAVLGAQAASVYVNSVDDASSQASGLNKDAGQAAGAPDGLSWSPKFQNTGAEWINARLAAPVRVTGISAVASNPETVVGVFAHNGYAWISSSAPSFGTFTSDRVRVELDTTLASGFNTIDAISVEYTDAASSASLTASADAQGSFGSNPGQASYDNGVTFTWTVSGDDGAKVTFTSFDLESGHDFVTVNAGSGDVQLTGTAGAGQTFSGASVTVTFTSDAAGTAHGFSATYSGQSYTGNACSQASECDSNALCTDSLCVCNSGFSGNGKSCANVDECASAGACGANQECQDSVGSFSCSCVDGFTDDGEGNCVDVDECSGSPCADNGVCVNTYGSFDCSCAAGYSGDGFACEANCVNSLAAGVDVQTFTSAIQNGAYPKDYSCRWNIEAADPADEVVLVFDRFCTEANDIVSVFDASGNELSGSPLFGCPNGYSPEQGITFTAAGAITVTMTSDDHVSLHGFAAYYSASATCPVCDANAHCSGSGCTCNAGFSGSGLQCVDINECATGACGDNAQCANTFGGFTCTCDDGFAKVNGQCVDVNECSTAGVCPASSTCVNSQGSFSCVCFEGFAGADCADINECDDAPCHADATCSNTAGSFGCSCKAGFSGDGFSCQNIDECSAGTASCSANADCLDSQGSYSCQCQDGYSGDGVTCSNVNECEVSSGGCGANSHCEDNEGSFACLCNLGYENSASGCVDVNECADASLNNCFDSAGCANHDGGFSCACPAGYAGDGVDCANVNECATSGICGADADCTDSDGSYSCACHDGFYSTANGCVDVDECAASPCGFNEVCDNTHGSFACSCPYEIIDNECVVANPCEGACGSAECVSTDGVSATCYCSACDQSYDDASQSCVTTVNCGADTCSGHGSCADTVVDPNASPCPTSGLTECSCDVHYAGEACDVGVNSAPQVSDFTVQATEDTPISKDAFAIPDGAVTDAEGDAFTCEFTSACDTSECSFDGSVVTPAANHFGETLVFSYVCTDAGGADWSPASSQSGNIFANFAAVADSPVIVSPADGAAYTKSGLGFGVIFYADAYDPDSDAAPTVAVKAVQVCTSTRSGTICKDPTDVAVTITDGAVGADCFAYTTSAGRNFIFTATGAAGASVEHTFNVKCVSSSGALVGQVEQADSEAAQTSGVVSALAGTSTVLFLVGLSAVVFVFLTKGKLWDRPQNLADRFMVGDAFDLSENPAFALSNQQ